MESSHPHQFISHDLSRCRFHESGCGISAGVSRGTCKIRPKHWQAHGLWPLFVPSGLPEGQHREIGVGRTERCQSPSLRTGLAVLPHPALRLVVLPPIGFRPESVCLGRTFTSLTTRAFRRTNRRFQPTESGINVSGSTLKGLTGVKSA